MCVAGALFMALYKGPALLGDGLSDMNLQGMDIAGNSASMPVRWITGILIDSGIDLWRFGVLCLIGNTLSMAIYIVYQVIIHVGHILQACDLRTSNVDILVFLSIMPGLV